MNIIGDIVDKDILIIDDIVDTAGTLCNAANALKERGARSIRACATHGLLSGPAIERIQNSALDELLILDTIPLPPEKRIDKIKVETVAPLFAQAISRIYTDKSVSTLFD
jgi:ribose-phosphate pyrophosphokinase